MKTIVKTVRLVLLFSLLGLPASLGFDNAYAATASVTSAARSTLSQDQVAASPDNDQLLHFDHISTEQGLSNLDVWSIVRDKRGFMWFGTEDGLNRFDGHQMRVFKHDREDRRSLSENTIRTLYVDGQGTLWIGTWTGGLERFEPQTQNFTHFRHDPNNQQSLSNDNIFALLEDQEGTLRVGTNGGLNRFDSNTGTFIST